MHIEQSDLKIWFLCRSNNINSPFHFQADSHNKRRWRR